MEGKVGSAQCGILADWHIADEGHLDVVQKLVFNVELNDSLSSILRGYQRRMVFGPPASSSVMLFGTKTREREQT